MARISLTEFTVPISTYGGNLDFSNFEEDEIGMEIENGYAPDLPELEKESGETDYSCVSCGEEFKKEFTEKCWQKLEPVLVPALAPYGLKVTGLEFWSPRFYNFQGDSLDLIYDEGEPADKTALLPFIQKYIDEVREPSRDGYTSFEKTEPEKYEPDDSGYVWVILAKEGKLDEIKEILEDVIEDAYEIYYTCFRDALAKFVMEKCPKWYRTHALNN